MKLGELIKKYRLEHDLSQRAFANLCGVSNGYVSIIEEGKNYSTGKKTTPTIPTLQKIAAGMGMTLDELFAAVDDIIIDVTPPITPAPDFPLTPHEKRLVTAYRENPQLQPIIDHTLSIDTEPTDGKTVGEDMADAAGDILDSLRKAQEPGTVEKSQS